MPIRQISVTFNVTERQYELLVMGKCDKPNPERVKRLLLNEAARQVRTVIEMGVRDEHDHKTKHKSIEQEMREADRRLRAARKSGYAEAVIDEGKQRARDTEKLLLADSKRKARDRAKVAKLSNSGLDENNLYTDE